MNHVIAQIQENGDLFYLLTFIWTALEGETFVIFAALAAQRGFLDIRLLFLAAALGSLFGDQVFFFLGRYFGHHIINRYPKIKIKLDKVLVKLETYSTSFILTYRFMYGVRNISALAVGMSRLTWKRFFVLNSIASFLWSFVFCGAGYLFGDIMAHLGRNEEEAVNFEVRSFMLAVLGMFVTVALLRYAYARYQSRLERKENDKQ